MGRSRVCVNIAASCSLLAATCSSPANAMDRNAAFGVGLGLGLLGSAIAAQRMQDQNRFYQQRRRIVYPIRRFVRPPRLAAALAPKSAQQNITTDEPWVTRSYWNCTSAQGLKGISAHAQHGFIQESYSTRIACSNNRQPVKVFTYLSPSHYTGSDRIEYFDGRRLSFTDYVQVGNFGRPFQPQTEVSLISNVERELVAYTGCKRSEMQTRADSGFATIRESRVSDSSCPGGGDKIRQALVFRSAQSFQGVDHVTLYSSFKEPIVFNVSVVAGNNDWGGVRTTNPSSPLSQTTSAQGTSVAECDMFLFKANAFFLRATTFCSTNYMDSKAGHAALEGARKCIASQGEDFKPKVQATMQSLDNVVRERGQAAACEIVESVAQQVLARVQ